MRWNLRHGKYLGRLDPTTNLPSESDERFLISFLTLSEDSPNRPPDWRWRKALSLYGLGYSVEDLNNLHNIDNQTRAAFDYICGLYEPLTNRDIDFLAAVNYAETQANRYIIDAFSIYEDIASYKRAELEARILAKQPAKQICKKFDINSSILRWYKWLFFDLRNNLDNPTYVIHNVIFNGSSHFDFRDDEAFIRFLGYSMGVPAVEYYLYRLNNLNEDDKHPIPFSQLEKNTDDFIKLLIWKYSNISDPETINLLNKLKSFIQINQSNSGFGSGSLGETAEKITDALDFVIKIRESGTDYESQSDEHSKIWNR